MTTHFFENQILKIRGPDKVRKNFIELWNKGVAMELFVTVGLTRFSAPRLVLTLVSAESGRGSITFQAETNVRTGPAADPEWGVNIFCCCQE